MPSIFNALLLLQLSKLSSLPLSQVTKNHLKMPANIIWWRGMLMRRRSLTLR